MKTLLIISLLCFLSSCLSYPAYKEYQKFKEIQKAEQEGRTTAHINIDGFLYLIWQNEKGEIIKMGRIPLPVMGEKL